MFLFLLFQSSGMGQPKEQSASDLIQELSHQPEVVAVPSDNYYPAAEQAFVESLVKLGPPAIPDIDAALDSLEKRGFGSEFIRGSDGLLIAYARIKGPAGFPRLRQMRGNPVLRDNLALDSAASLSLGLTSYVRMAGWRPLMSVDNFRAMRRSTRFGHRDALDLMIFAWEIGDRALLEESLGPNARTALDKLLKDRTWEALRAQLWRVKPSDMIAVGYRFNAPGPWSDPAAEYSGGPELDTLFKNGLGKDCGRHRIRFQSPDFGVDNSDIGDLLRLISRCAADQ
jgi:hypothetical protein